MPKRVRNKQINWSFVKQYFQENTPSGYAMSIVEAEKLFRSFLIQSGFPGATPAQQISNAKPIFTHLKDLQSARDTFTKITEEIEYELDPEEVSYVLRAYHQAITDLSQKREAQLSFLNKIILAIKFRTSGLQTSWRKISIVSFAFLLFILFLAKTAIGNWFVAGIVTVAEFLVTWVLIIGLIVVGIVFLVIGSLAYFDSRKKKKGLAIEHEK